MANYGKYYIAERLLLLKQYLEANAGKNRIVERKDLEAFLEEHDINVEKKTLYADFAALGNICGMQLEYDPHKKGYRLLNPPFEPYELRLLVDSVQSSKFITREKAMEITAKVKRLAGKDTVESLNYENHVANRVRSMNDSVVKDVDRIHQAIRKDMKIGFRYFHYVQVIGNTVEMVLVIGDGNIGQALCRLGDDELPKNFFHGLAGVSIHCDFSCHNQTSCLS